MLLSLQFLMSCPPQTVANHCHRPFPPFRYKVKWRSRTVLELGRLVPIAFLLLLIDVHRSFSQSKLLDDFELLGDWRAIPSDGARMKLTSTEGKTGKAMVMEFDLTGAYGYTIAQKDFSLDL